MESPSWGSLAPQPEIGPAVPSLQLQSAATEVAPVTWTSPIQASLMGSALMQLASMTDPMLARAPPHAAQRSLATVSATPGSGQDTKHVEPHLTNEPLVQVNPLELHGNGGGASASTTTTAASSGIEASSSGANEIRPHAATPNTSTTIRIRNMIGERGPGFRIDLGDGIEVWRELMVVAPLPPTALLRR